MLTTEVAFSTRFTLTRECTPAPRATSRVQHNAEQLMAVPRLYGILKESMPHLATYPMSDSPASSIPVSLDARLLQRSWQNGTSVRPNSSKPRNCSALLLCPLTLRIPILGAEKVRSRRRCKKRARGLSPVDQSMAAIVTSRIYPKEVRSGYLFMSKGPNLVSVICIFLVSVARHPHMPQKLFHWKRAL